MQKHLLVKKDKTTYLCVEIEERGKTRKILLARVHGWRAELAYKFFNFTANGWNDDVARAFLGLNVLRIAEDEWTARKYINAVREMKKLDLHFWVDKFLKERDRADRAWRVFYEK
uniref:Uncharacterized protein n=1 Tax=Archaeoglobus fulgidus TaxID=2234 RepID=A0A7C3RCU1_ARCFL